MNSIRELLAAAAQLPADTATDAPLLLAHTLDKDRSWLYAWPEHCPAPEQLEHYQALLRRRLHGEPLAYLTGHKEFWSLQLRVTPDTLIPRPETELLVETALALPVKSTRAQVLDLGTGSGAIALALASERPGWQLTATDISKKALALAAQNAAQHSIHNICFVCSPWFQGLEADLRCHIILSNPPYVAEDDPHLQQDGLPHEPISALTAGADGLQDLRTIIGNAPGFLQPGGWLLVEHGMDQGTAVRQLFGLAGFRRIETRQDLEYRDRITLGCYSR
ncbi:peptide chain release factor N(5)-glutamine methyltransferase [Thiolapillus sp.]